MTKYGIDFISETIMVWGLLNLIIIVFNVIIWQLLVFLK